jgi:hypothetical protein
MQNGRAKAIHPFRFQAYRNLDHYSSGSGSDDQRRVKGLFVDSIKFAGGGNDDSWDNGNFILQNSSSKTLVSWRELCEEVFPSPRENAYIGGGTAWQAYVTTLTNTRSAQAHDGYSIEELYELVIRDTQVNLMSLPHPFAVVVGVCTAKRRLIVTEKGYIGLGPLDVQMGDEVFVLQGGQVPFVLRRYEEFGVLRHGLYVGDCYIHGTMKEELLDQTRSSKFEHITIRSAAEKDQQKLQRRREDDATMGDQRIWLGIRMPSNASAYCTFLCHCKGSSRNACRYLDLNACRDNVVIRFPKTLTS